MGARTRTATERAGGVGVGVGSLLLAPGQEPGAGASRQARTGSRSRETEGPPAQGRPGRLTRPPAALSGPENPTAWRAPRWEATSSSSRVPVPAPAPLRLLPRYGSGLGTHRLGKLTNRLRHCCTSPPRPRPPQFRGGACAHERLRAGKEVPPPF